MNALRAILARSFLVLLCCFPFPALVSADDICDAYTGPLSVPVTTEAEYVANIALGNQRRLAYLLDAVAVPYRYDDAVELMERIEATLLPYFPQGAPVYNYEYFVVDRSVEKNYASASDGGPIRVSEELILVSKYVDELAFVLAHEMSHVVSQDTTRFLDVVNTKAIDYQKRLREDIRVTDPVLKKARDEERRAVLMQGSVDSDTLMQPHELEADIFAAHVATRAGYNPELMAQFFDRMHEERGNKPVAPTHPADVDRATLLRCFTPLPAGSTHDDLDAQFRAVQERLFQQRRAVEASAQNK